MGLDIAVRYFLLARVTVRVIMIVHGNCVQILLRISRHLLGQGREEEARRVVAILSSVPEDDPAVIEQVEELVYGIRAENEGGKVTWLECFSTRNMLWKRTLNGKFITHSFNHFTEHDLSGMIIMFVQQLNGQNFYCEPQSFEALRIRIFML